MDGERRPAQSFLKMLGGFLLLGLAFLGALLLQHWGYDPAIASTPMLLVIALVALFWGNVPALVTLLISVVALDYLILEPVGTLHFPTWKALIQLLPFLMSGVLIAIFTAQRERARYLAECAQKDAERYADEVEQDTLLREMVLSLAADVIQEKVANLVQDTGQQRLPEANDPQITRGASPLETAGERVELLQRLIADLPSLKTIHSSMILFDQSPPYDLYEITQALIEEQRHNDGQEIILQRLSPAVMLARDAEQVTVILICLLQYVLGAFLESKTINICLNQKDKEITIQVFQANEDYVHDKNYKIEKMDSGNNIGLWWLICMECVKRQGGQLTLREEEQTLFVILP